MDLVAAGATTPNRSAGVTEAFRGQSLADPRLPQGTEWPTLSRRVGRKDGPLQDGRDLRAPVQFTGPPARQTGPGLLLFLTHHFESLPAPRTKTAPSACGSLIKLSKIGRVCWYPTHTCLFSGTLKSFKKAWSECFSLRLSFFFFFF